MPNLKKLTILSMIAAAMLFVGCGDKTKEAATDATAKAAESTKEAADKTAADAVKEAGDAISKATDAVVAATKEAADKTADAAKESAGKAVAATKEAASDAADKVKEGAAAATTAVATAVADTAASVAGAAAYAKCAGCHGADGKTKALGKSPEIAGQSKEELITKINGYKAGTLDTAGMGTLMKGQVASMSDADIDAVAGYISTLK
ncbi:MAG: c-type cytochrome [Campylobacterota bacterium]|nr:c-type cytochrome [Campylobacterota bacterium]